MLQLAGRDIMARTVPMLAPQTAKHVYLLTVHVVVNLVGRDPTVALVFTSNSQHNQISNINVPYFN